MIKTIFWFWTERIRIGQGLRFLGVKQFTQRDGAHRYIVFFFKTDTYSGELKSSNEGKVFWIDRKDISDYILADGFEDMLTVFENDNLSENYYWRGNGKLYVKKI